MCIRTRNPSFRALVVAILTLSPGLPGVQAGSVLLGSINFNGGAGVSPAEGGPVEIVLRHESVLDGFLRNELGRGTLWDSDTHGVFDFSVLNAPRFEAVSNGLTNGVDDYISVLVEWPGVGGGGFLHSESQLLSGSPDLTGTRLDFVRLVVDELAIEPWLEGFFANTDVTFEFWGTVVPEPSTLTLLGLSCLSSMYRRRGRFH